MNMLLRPYIYIFWIEEKVTTTSKPDGLILESQEYPYLHYWK